MPIPLCVPFEAKASARAAGAAWNGADKVWECDPAALEGSGYAALRPFLPRIHRREVSPPFIRPMMVPQGSWGKNLRSVLSGAEWDQVRRRAYDRAGRRCIVCGERGPEWPVEADEAWAYDDAACVQTLKGVVALCPACHLVRHWGKAIMTGQDEIAVEHMMRLNNWTRRQAEAEGDAGMESWQARSQRDWQVDYSWVTRAHGITVSAEGISRAEAVNREIVEKALSDED